VRVKAAVLGLVCCIALLGCRAPAPMKRLGPAPRSPQPVSPGGRTSPVTPVTPATPGVVLGPFNSDIQAGLPDLEGGPESATRPHEDPPTLPPDVYMRGDPHLRLMALTFDDGPDDRFTPMVLDILKHENVKATFFLVGRRAARRPDLVRRIVAEGHDIGNHSMTHPLLTKVTPVRLHAELEATDHLLRHLTGRPVTLFRPPYGAFDQPILQAAKALGYRTVLWDIDSLDWKRGMTRDTVIAKVLGGARPGAIVLEHSAGGVGEDLTDTTMALPVIIRTLRAHGYRLVTMSELLSTGHPRPGVW
jgi:peptidoglycan/xylan/chitin deacetylase (PgdA/CDA1 family)